MNVSQTPIISSAICSNTPHPQPRRPTLAPQTQLQAYHDCIEIYQAALDNPAGVRIKLATYERAKFMQNRLHQARVLDREENARMFPDDHPMHGNSPFDKLVVRNPREDTTGFWWIYIEPHGIEVLAIEALTPDEPEFDFNETSDTSEPV